MVTSGTRWAVSVSVNVKKNMTAVSARLVAHALSSTQNQYPRQRRSDARYMESV
jgi:hypothetical protein